MPSAVAADVWLLIADWLTEDRPALCSLCLVSRKFRDIFSKTLYSQVQLDEERAWEYGSRAVPGMPFYQAHQTMEERVKVRAYKSSILGLPQSKHLIDTKTLVVAYGGSFEGQDYLVERFRPLIETLLHKMTNLTTVRFGRITLADEWLQNLQIVTNLEELYIAFSCPWKNGERVPFKNVQLKCFNEENFFPSLRRLTIQSIYLDDNTCLPKYIASILRNSSQLDYLRLSVDFGPCNNIIQRICAAYDEYKTPNPLRLKWLSLGRFVHLPEADVMGKLTILSELERVYVAGCKCRDSLGLFPSWGVFDPITTPKLENIELANVCPADWEYIPNALRGRKVFKIWNIPNQKTSTLSLFEMAQKTKVPMLQLPVDVSTPTAFETWFLKDLHKCVWLTHLKLDLKFNSCFYTGCRSSDSGFQCFLPTLSAVFSQLPNLIALQYHSYSGDGWKRCHDEDDLTVAATSLAERSKLEYVQIFSVAFAIQRQDGTLPVVVKLSQATQALMPKFFDHE